MLPLLQQFREIRFGTTKSLKWSVLRSSTSIFALIILNLTFMKRLNIKKQWNIPPLASDYSIGAILRQFFNGLFIFVSLLLGCTSDRVQKKIRR